MTHNEDDHKTTTVFQKHEGALELFALLSVDTSIPISIVNEGHHRFWFETFFDGKWLKKETSISLGGGGRQSLYQLTPLGVRVASMPLRIDAGAFPGLLSSLEWRQFGLPLMHLYGCAERRQKVEPGKPPYRPSAMGYKTARIIQLRAAQNLPADSAVPDRDERSEMLVSQEIDDQWDLV